MTEEITKLLAWIETQVEQEKLLEQAKEHIREAKITHSSRKTGFCRVRDYILTHFNPKAPDAHLGVWVLDVTTGQSISDHTMECLVADLPTDLTGGEIRQVDGELTWVCCHFCIKKADYSAVRIVGNKKEGYVDLQAKLESFLFERLTKQGFNPVSIWAGS